MAQAEAASNQVHLTAAQNAQIYASLSQLRQSSGSRSCWSGEMHLPVRHVQPVQA